MFRSVSLVISILVFVQLAVAQTKPSPFYLSHHLNSPFVHKSLDELEKDWPAFQHRPFSESGFSHLVLPFHYEDSSNDGHPNEALSFSFLMYNSVAWSPGCYQKWHPFFIFTHEEKCMKYLCKKYNGDLIAKLIHKWDATHALGGKIIRTKEGYHGVLKIYDNKGNLIHRVEYSQPQSYFSLLGNMSVDAMTFLDETPSKGLAEYLCMNRCKQFQSLVKLGNAAFRCGQLSIYTDILDKDPGFADVRYYWALRKSWRDDDKTFFHNQLGISMQSYLTEGALTEFQPQICPTWQYIREFSQHLSKMEDLVGPNHPVLLIQKLRNFTNAKNRNLSLFEHALTTAKQYPNSYYLLKELYRAYGIPPMGYDADMRNSLCISMIRCRHVTSTIETYIDNMKPLCETLHLLGQSAVAGDLLSYLCENDLQKKGLESGESWIMELLGDIFCETGQYDEAIKWYRVAFKRLKFHQGRRNLVVSKAAIAAALAGRLDVIDQILHDRQEELKIIRSTPLINAYRDVLTGKDVDLNAIANLKFKHFEEWGSRQQNLFLAQMDLKNGTRNYRTQFIGHIVHWPLSRQMWAIFDGYERQEPSEAGCGFYHALEWLYPEDPWVKKAVADYRERTPKDKQNEFVPIKTLMEMLKPFSPQRYPKGEKKFTKYPEAFKYSYADYAYGIKRLIDKRDFAQAREMALRFNTMLSGTKFNNLRYMANHLIHKVEDAERQAQPKIFARR